ncbi:MAG: ASCH domain-containing protein [Planctomycetaceae bacterium]
MLFLSIHPRFVAKIFSGEKTIELRRRQPRGLTSEWVAIYATTPEMQLRGIARISEIRVDGVRDMWKHAKIHAAVTKKEYDSYFADSNQAVGIVLRDPMLFSKPVALDHLRKIWPQFQPPQGFRYLNEEQVEDVQSLLPRRSWSGA